MWLEDYLRIGLTLQGIRYSRIANIASSLVINSRIRQPLGECRGAGNLRESVVLRYASS